MGTDLCSIVIYLYIITCILYALGKAKEASDEKSVTKKVVNFIMDVILCPLQLLLKLLKKKETGQ